MDVYDILIYLWINAWIDKVSGREREREREREGGGKTDREK